MPVCWGQVELRTHLEALAASHREKCKNLNEETMQHWAEIVGESYVFTRRHQAADAVDALTLADLLKFFDAHIARDAPLRVKLATRGASAKARAQPPPADPADDHHEFAVGTPLEFARALPLLPLPRPPALFTANTASDDDTARVATGDATADAPAAPKAAPTAAKSKWPFSGNALPTTLASIGGCGEDCACAALVEPHYAPKKRAADDAPSEDQDPLLVAAS